MNAGKIRLLTLACAICLVVGASITVQGLISLFRTKAFLDGSTEVPGQIVGFEKQEGERKGPTYSPIFSFTDPAGTVHTCTSRWATSHISHAVGDRVTVLFNGSDPRRAEIKGFQMTWIGPSLFTGAGLAFVGLASIGLFISSHMRRRTKSEGST